MTQFAVIGAGKTGGKVVEVLDGQQVVGPFDEFNKPTADKLREADAAILFVPASAVDDLLEPLVESGIPAAWGTTGYKWPEDLDERLRNKGIKWLRASNFSLGMNIVRRCLKVIGQSSSVLTDPEFHIHEIHHVHKVDAPSGTALSWREWLGQDAEITSERKGDIKGIHQLDVKTETESIRMEHQAHDRKIFAQGAIWAAEQLLKPDIEPGFHDFATIFDYIMEQT
ncbi:dihydrodipicolinate reductase C-terminal domain-containing protein [Fodinibius sediminis]|uniref:4-hydroxy-tetrahydrodipicolinate reductase n=1 Tax=Fodinibius sediminis TaxID=1214077 RepID=A0A521CB70_9BACT|nr:dihydrodipicolinate reductase C-terminal domain-containing protein [Fodinibius sediminis]SMO56683.1 4-hydroxy-tetrahydrodipicolinate reductase [Fodinibius sediminis]